MQSKQYRDSSMFNSEEYRGEGQKRLLWDKKYKQRIGNK